MQQQLTKENRYDRKTTYTRISSRRPTPPMPPRFTVTEDNLPEPSLSSPLHSRTGPLFKHSAETVVSTDSYPYISPLGQHLTGVCMHDVPYGEVAIDTVQTML